MRADRAEIHRVRDHREVVHEFQRFRIHLSRTHASAALCKVTPVIIHPVVLQGVVSPELRPREHTYHQPSQRDQTAFSGPGCVLALAGIRRRVVQIKAMEKDELPPL